VAPITVLQLAETHRAALLTHFLALGGEDRRLRFGQHIADDLVRRYVDGVDFERHGVFGVLGEDLALLGVAHLVAQGSSAEFGLSVLPEARGRGIGKLLFERMVEYARNRNVRSLFMHCLAENDAMMHIARRYGMQVILAGGEVEAYMALPPADPLSVANEMLEQRVALFDFALKSQIMSARRLSDAVIGPPAPDAGKSNR
jgi:hypothetical protein